MLPEFRRRFDMDFLVAVNEELLASAPPTAERGGERKPKKAGKAKGGAKKAEKAKKAEGGGEDGGTLILDATCSPSDVRFPQDFSLLNEARKDLDAMIDRLHAATGGARARTTGNCARPTSPWPRRRGGRRMSAPHDALCWADTI